MKTLTREDLAALAQKSPSEPAEWIRVQLDTGGIAAGAESLAQALEHVRVEQRLDFALLRTGSIGYSFADPVIEVKSAALPRILYGNMSPRLVPALLDGHVRTGHLLEDHVIATRNRGLTLAAPVTHILVRDTGGDSGNKTEFFQFSLQEELKRRGLDDRVQVVRALDMGIYDEGAVVQLLPDAVTYTNVLAPDVARIVSESIEGQKVLDDLIWSTPDKQVRIVLRHCGQVDPESADDYLQQAEGYQALAKVLFEMSPEQVLAEMKASSLRGRGGAGFPTWLKWQLTRAQPADQHYVICNGDEGDPGHSWIAVFWKVIPTPCSRA